MCEPVLRNHPPHAPFVVRWAWPVMYRDDALDPSRLKKVNTGREPQFDVQQLVSLLEGKRLRAGEFAALALEKMSRATFFRLRNLAVAKGLIAKNLVHQWQVVSEVSECLERGSETIETVSVSQPFRVRLKQSMVKQGKNGAARQKGRKAMATKKRNGARRK